jgi:stalled ribosome rescue protein Dom34
MPIDLDQGRTALARQVQVTQTTNWGDNMRNKHGCVWLDHREAKIFGVSQSDFEEVDVDVEDTQSAAHIHRKTDGSRLGAHAPDHAYFDEIAGVLGSFKGIVITGPGAARTELAGYLSQHYPLIAKRVWGIEAVDHPTPRQIVAAARKYFHAAVRMHE